MIKIGIKDLIIKMKEKRDERNKEISQLGDDETRDKHLRSLRRQRRVQLEEVEKKRLMEDINTFEKNKVSRDLFGIKNPEKSIKKKKSTPYTFLEKGSMNNKTRLI